MSLTSEIYTDELVTSVTSQGEIEKICVESDKEEVSFPKLYSKSF